MVLAAAVWPENLRRPVHPAPTGRADHLLRSHRRSARTHPRRRPASRYADDAHGFDAGGTGATAYAEAVATYLAFAASRAYDYGCTISTWRPKDNAMRAGMSKQAIPMTWDFAEGNPFGESSAGFVECAAVVAKVIATSLAPFDSDAGHAVQRNAAGPFPDGWRSDPVVSTDPPYYDNIGYADLSDFFYVCLRRILRSQYPSLFATVA